MARFSFLSFALGLVAGAIILVLILFLNRRRELKPNFPESSPCGDKTVKIETSAPGADPETVVLCQGDHVKWDRSGQSFAVSFLGEKPFVDDQGREVGEINERSPRVKPKSFGLFGAFICYQSYKYQVKVDDQTFDPRGIIIGGP